MSSKHYFPETAVNTLVPRALQALVAANPSLSFLDEHRVVLNTTHKSSNVALISGGGSGHEPAWSGYVGDGLLSAVACGDIFASPSMKQVLAAIASVPSEKGTILLITNYTGDKLHFGLAAERALAAGFAKKVVVLPATDDVSIGRSRCEKVGRRGLAGNVITMKVLGAAASQEYSYERLVDIGKAVNNQLVSIGSALDHCHVPGRQNHDEIGDDVCVVGAGIHNEPGAQKVSPFPSVEDLIAQLLTLICDQKDPERGFVRFSDNDDTVLLINNYGGLSNLELGALTQETLSQLESKWRIKPTKIYAAPFETSLNGPGFSITLCNLTIAAKESNTSVDELLGLLAYETKAPAWPNVLSNTSTKAERKPTPVVDIEKQTPISTEEDITVDPTNLEATVRLACERAIKSEPDLTKWDMVMGDGDCGEAVKGVCEAVLKILDNGTAKSGSVFELLYAVIDAVDDMGGTLGAIFGILLAALASSLRTEKQKGDGSLLDVFAPALTQAVGALKNHTGARVGDRTVMDVLLPFQETLESARDFEKAVREAEKAAEGTRGLKPKFGRASYVGAGGEEQHLPDPGAWALMEMVRGLYDASP
ncbi:DAK1/DegV-like protein [Glarea lozoyensis ATCC 20868]|uniref:DAK1/DegV-like protein n=1 Tax=Glarea lozoyensis (strain ATCC 20868 / MF5171) TaxID=1116229 RepID=S3CMG8_GLAL2|nr:DAK1/DegV-like protein [Glarea lozoyensis ATCC 20868]EPE26915.1 DAK1/DegV-like protein [Glarea lozoyensis ATCC 20868]